MEAAARDMPGFVDFKTFEAEDGEKVSLVTFASAEDHRAWRDDPRHRAAQQQGRDQFYERYSVQVGECVHVSTWTGGG
jgi:heme-degrading monooxygenase HmoA